MSARNRRLVKVVESGPVLVQGPVHIVMPDGSTVDSDRFMVAICACRRSKTYPLCDTSHRAKVPSPEPSAEGVAQRCPPG
jgi:CDGSH-type Zn-finger protein